MRKDDLFGQRFGRLTVTREGERTSSGRVRWHCVCDCGNELDVYGPSLKSGNTKSCGCYHSEKARDRLMTHGFGSRTNRPRIYSIWCAMKNRCYRPVHKEFSRYGGRGITVCEEWKEDFLSFKRWADASGYSDDLEIDRIDNDKGYSPQNCQWVTRKENSNNRSKTLRIYFRGTKRTISEISEMTGLSYWIVYQRAVKLRWSGEDLAKPSRLSHRKP